MAEKKNILTYAGLRKLEDELQDLKVNKRNEVAQKIREAREQGDLSENAEYDAEEEEMSIAAVKNLRTAKLITAGNGEKAQLNSKFKSNE